MSKKLSRRCTLKRTTAGAASLIGLAGCMTDDGEGDGTGDDGEGDGTGDEEEMEPEWPPRDRRVDIGQHHGPGANAYSFALYAANHLPKHIPSGDEIEFTVANLEGGGGTRLANYVSQHAPNGEFLGMTNMSALLNSAIFQKDRAKYDPADLMYLGSVRSYSRGILVNPRTTDVDSHWDWEWQDFIDQAEDLRYAILGVGHGSHVFASLLGHFHPDIDLEKMQENFLMYSGGGEARAAIQRGEADVYLSSFSGQYLNDDFYYMQFLASDSRFEAYNEGVKSIDPNTKTLGEYSDFEEDSLHAMNDLTIDRQIFYYPPVDPNNELYNMWVDAIDGVFQDEGFVDDLRPLASEEMFPLFYTPEVEPQDAVESAWETRLEYEDLIHQLY